MGWYELVEWSRNSHLIKESRFQIQTSMRKKFMPTLKKKELSTRTGFLMKLLIILFH